jgi:hypothetical protein
MRRLFIVAVAGGEPAKMHPVGLAADASVRVTLAWDAIVERLGSVED